LGADWARRESVFNWVGTPLLVLLRRLVQGSSWGRATAPRARAARDSVRHGVVLGL